MNFTHCLSDTCPMRNKCGRAMYYSCLSDAYDFFENEKCGDEDDYLMELSIREVKENGGIKK